MQLLEGISSFQGRRPHVQHTLSRVYYMQESDRNVCRALHSLQLASLRYLLACVFCNACKWWPAYETSCTGDTLDSILRNRLQATQLSFRPHPYGLLRTHCNLSSSQAWQTGTACSSGCRCRNRIPIVHSRSNAFLSGTWQSLSVIVKPTPNARFRPEKVAYYKTEVLPRMYGFAAVAVVVLLLLLYWIIWCGKYRMLWHLHMKVQRKLAAVAVAALVDRTVHHSGSQQVM